MGGITFASKREAKRYGELMIEQRAGAIRDLRIQIPYVIEVNGVRICRYVADFVYFRVGEGPAVEDAKGMQTPVYRLKKKLMKAVHGITIREV